MPKPEKVYVLMCGNKPVNVWLNSFDAWESRDSANKYCTSGEHHRVVEVPYYV
jgi:hypothetical protein